MATTSPADAVVVPQAKGTGLGSEDDNIDAASSALLAGYLGGEYVGSGLQFQNHDATNDTVDISPGYCFVVDDSTSTAGSRSAGGNPQVQSTSSSGYDTPLPNDPAYLVVLPTSVTVSCSANTLTSVWVNLDVTANNGVELRTSSGGGTTAAPSDTFLKLGETNPDDSTADTRSNLAPTIPNGLRVEGGNLAVTENLVMDSGLGKLVSQDGTQWLEFQDTVMKLWDDDNSYALANFNQGGPLQFPNTDVEVGNDIIIDSSVGKIRSQDRTLWLEFQGDVIKIWDDDNIYELALFNQGGPIAFPNTDVTVQGSSVVTAADGAPTTAASGTVTLSGGSATISTGITTTGTTVDVLLDPSGSGANAADVKVRPRIFWDNSAGEYKVDILEDGTSVGNPDVTYDVVTL